MGHQFLLGGHKELSSIHFQRETTLYQTANVIRYTLLIHDRHHFELHALGSNKQNGLLIPLALELNLRRDQPQMVTILGRKLRSDVLSRVARP